MDLSPKDQTCIWIINMVSLSILASDTPLRYHGADINVEPIVCELMLLSTRQFMSPCLNVR